MIPANENATLLLCFLFPVLFWSLLMSLFGVSKAGNFSELVGIELGQPLKDYIGAEKTTTSVCLPVTLHTVHQTTNSLRSEND